MKVWISKYALTEGLFEAEGVISDVSPNMIGIGKMQYFHKPDWHTSKAEATERAEKMRLAKIKSLNKSLFKFTALKFS